MNKLAGPTNSNTSVKRTSFVLLLVIALLNTMGMTIIIPLVPFLTLQYLAHPTNLAAIVGWLTTAYGLSQLIVAPGLGVLSDRFGRRPILFICLLGSVIGYLIFGLGGALWLLFLGRIIDGLTGGNISILFGYIADITEPEDRGKYFGMLGISNVTHSGTWQRSQRGMSGSRTAGNPAALNTSTQRFWLIMVFWPPAPMVALSLPSLSIMACTPGMPKEQRSIPTASRSRSGSKLTNMNRMHLALLRCKVGSIASTW